MEAKGCAKPAVWTDARRRFYWLVRARVARSAALAKFAEASPASTHADRSQLLDSLASTDATSDARAVAESIERLDLSKAIAQLKAEHLLRSLLDLANQDRQATMDTLLRLVDELSEEEKGSLGSALQTSAQRHGALSFL
jgi:acetyl-CoA carboxylase/biotin carboxylase 1